MIHAIETYYRGHRFRSRLEARWAVWLDTMGIRYEYEPEGFDFGGVRYLPDFYLPDHGVWLEIKPVWQGYYKQCDLLARERAERVLLVYGNPWLGEYGINLYEPDGCHGGIPYGFHIGRKTEEELWVAHEEHGAYCLNPLDDSDRWPLAEHPRLDRAYRAARGARFEFADRQR